MPRPYEIDDSPNGTYAAKRVGLAAENFQPNLPPSPLRGAQVSQAVAGFDPEDVPAPPKKEGKSAVDKMIDSATEAWAQLQEKQGLPADAAHKQHFALGLKLGMGTGMADQGGQQSQALLPAPAGQGGGFLPAPANMPALDDATRAEAMARVKAAQGTGGYPMASGEQMDLEDQGYGRPTFSNGVAFSKGDVNRALSVGKPPGAKPAGNVGGTGSGSGRGRGTRSQGDGPVQADAQAPAKDPEQDALDRAGKNDPGLDQLRSMLAKYQSGEGRQVDLSPVAALVDSWTGSHLLNGYSRPMNEHQRQQAMAGLAENLARRESDIDWHKSQIADRIAKRQGDDAFRNKRLATQDTWHSDADETKRLGIATKGSKAPDPAKVEDKLFSRHRDEIDAVTQANTKFDPNNKTAWKAGRRKVHGEMLANANAYMQMGIPGADTLDKAYAMAAADMAAHPHGADGADRPKKGE